MSDAYAKAGVDQGAADSAVAGLVRALGAIKLGRPSLQVPLPGHYASVIKLDENARDRALDRRGRDQAAGRRGAGALRHGRDRLRGDERQRRDLRRRRAAGDARLHRRASRPTRRSARRSASASPAGRSWPGSRSPAASSPSSATWSPASTSPAPASAPSPSTRSSTARRCEPGDVVIGLPSSGIHSNGYTLARAALAGIPLDDERLGRPLGEVLLEPTEIYVKPIVELLRSDGRRPRPRPHHLRRHSATCCGWRPRSATRSTTRCRCRRSSS